MSKPALCGIKGCRRLRGHEGEHDVTPSDPWSFLNTKDKRKISKAGFATPRGGAKGAYQNHVARSSRVIVPFERLDDVNLELFKDGYIVRLLPEQYFAAKRQPKREFLPRTARLRVGENAFVLYRTHDSLAALPPMPGWKVRGLRKAGKVVSKRGYGAVDTGHYVLRIPRLGSRPRRFEGPPQGVFAPEYADSETNFVTKCVLAWLIIVTSGSPYSLADGLHLELIIRSAGLDLWPDFARSGTIRDKLTSCPLCLRSIAYGELHATVSFEDEGGLVNASEQIEGATRSTVVSLFHIMPLLYDQLTHVPANIGWGHAVCNTRLGQRPCYSIDAVTRMRRAVSVREGAKNGAIGWISSDGQMIRSPQGAVWIRLNPDIAAGPPQEPGVFDEASPQAAGDQSEDSKE